MRASSPIVPSSLHRLCYPSPGLSNAALMIRANVNMRASISHHSANVLSGFTCTMPLINRQWLSCYVPDSPCPLSADPLFVLALQTTAAPVSSAGVPSPALTAPQPTGACPPCSRIHNQYIHRLHTYNPNTVMGELAPPFVFCE